MFQFRGLEALFGEAKPTVAPPHGDGTASETNKLFCLVWHDTITIVANFDRMRLLLAMKQLHD